MSDGSADTQETLEKKKIGDPMDVMRRVTVHSALQGEGLILGDSRSLTGYYARRDEFGRLMFDQCETTHKHLTDASRTTPNGVCLVSLEQLIPDEALNRRGKWVINIYFEPDDSVSTEKLSELVGASK